jgi:hypothetical protein
VEWLETRPEAIQAREQYLYYCPWYMAVEISIDIGVRTESAITKHSAVTKITFMSKNYVFYFNVAKYVT